MTNGFGQICSWFDWPIFDIPICLLQCVSHLSTDGINMHKRPVNINPSHNLHLLEQQLRSADDDERFAAMRDLLPLFHAQAQQTLLHVLRYRDLMPTAWIRARLLALSLPQGDVALRADERYHLREVLAALDLWDNEAYLPVLLAHLNELLSHSQTASPLLQECCEVLLSVAPADLHTALQQHGLRLADVLT